MKNCHLVVIPTSLLQVDGVEDVENWTIDWKPTTTATMMQEIRAYNALRREQFVRRNVSLETFLAWKLENPRSFITERAMRHITSKSVLDPSE